MRSLVLNLLLFIILFSSCTVSQKQLTSQNYHVEFYKADFEYSQQVVGNATIVKVLGIDWRRLFKKSEGGIDNSLKMSSFQGVAGATSVQAADGINPYVSVNYVLKSLPIVGSILNNYDDAYAVHDLLTNNTGYDVLIFPQFENRKVGFPLIYTKNTVKVTARLAKIKN